MSKPASHLIDTQCVVKACGAAALALLRKRRLAGRFVDGDFVVCSASGLTRCCVLAGSLFVLQTGSSCSGNWHLVAAGGPGRRSAQQISALHAQKEGRAQAPGGQGAGLATASCCSVRARCWRRRRRWRRWNCRCFKRQRTCRAAGHQCDADEPQPVSSHNVDFKGAAAAHFPYSGRCLRGGCSCISIFCGGCFWCFPTVRHGRYS